jgi:ATP-dependent DNA ligase
MHIPDSEVDPPLTYFVFDVLVAEGEDVKGLELRKRKSRLFELFDERAGGPSALVKMVFWASASGDAVANLLDAGYEGAVVKDLGSRYRPGVKGHGWCKIKRVDAEDLVCVGWFPAKRGSKYDGKAIGGLLCDRDGTEIRVGTGFDDEDRRRWLEKPSLVVGKVIEVAFNQGATARSGNGQVRNASFVRVRDPRDKAAGDVVHSRQRETRNAKRVPRCQLVREPVTVGAGGASRRNYSAMGEEKLTRCIAELLDERGDAYDRAVGAGADPAADLAKAIEIANEKGWA